MSSKLIIQSNGTCPVFLLYMLLQNGNFVVWLTHILVPVQRWSGTRLQGGGGWDGAAHGGRRGAGPWGHTWEGTSHREPSGGGVWLRGGAPTSLCSVSWASPGASGLPARGLAFLASEQGLGVLLPLRAWIGPSASGPALHRMEGGREQGSPSSHVRVTSVTPPAAASRPAAPPPSQLPPPSDRQGK